MSPSTANKKRLTLVKGGALALFGLAAFSQAKVQIIDGLDTIARAKKTQRFQKDIRNYARRGVIYSTEGKPLALDQDTYVLGINFEKVPQSDAFFVDLSAATGVPASEFAALAASGTPQKQWHDPISGERAKAVNRVKSAWRADGVSVVRTGQRAYPLGDMAAGIVGSIREKTPVNGLEKSLNEVLAGTDGLSEGLIDRTGHILPMRAEEVVKRVDGRDVYLTIDSDLQTVAAAAVREAVDKSKADAGVAIVVDPSTGDVLAMANWPSFDPASTGGSTGSSVQSDVNPNTMSRWEPGSMMKILTLAKALDCGAVEPADHMYCQGEYRVTPKAKPVKCDAHGGHRAHGDITLKDAIAKSCNVSAAQWALRVGYGNFVNYIEALGVLDKVDVMLPYEASGSLNRNDPAHQLQLACLGFGQSITVPPLNLAGAFTAFANNGVRMQPRLIRQIGSQVIPPKPGGQVFKPETAARVLGYMESVVESDEGTGKTLRIPGYRLAGKTGTAERIGRPGKGYVSNFVGFVPSVHPRAQILVMVDHPTNGSYYGATVAGPVFLKLAQACIRRFNIPPTEPITHTSKTAAVHP